MSGSPADGNAGLAEPPMTDGLVRAIRDLPERLQATLATDQNQLASASALAGGSRRVRLCGSGPDLEAAHAGEWLLRDIGISAFAQHSYDLAEFPTGFEPGDLVIGIDLIGDESVGRAIRLANGSGLGTLAITNRELTPYSPSVTLSVEAADEGALLDTPALPAALLATIASRIEPASATARSLSSLSDAIREMDVARTVAREVADVVESARPRIVIGAVGPSLWAARAGARLIRRVTGIPIAFDHLQSLVATTGILIEADILIEIALEPGEQLPSDRLRPVAAGRDLMRWRIGGTAGDATWHTPSPNLGATLIPFTALVALYWLAVELAGRTSTEARAT